MTIDGLLFNLCRLSLVLAFVSNVISIGGLAPIAYIAPLLLLFLVGSFLFSKNNSTHPMPKSTKLLQFSLGLLIILTLINPLLYGVEGERGRAFLFYSLDFGLVLAIMRSARSELQLASLLSLFRILVMLLIAIGVVENITGFHLPNSRHFDDAFSYADPYIPTGTLYNENQFATVVVLGIAFLLSGLATTKAVGKKILFGIFSLLGVFTVIQTDSRLNLIGIFLVAAGFVWFYGLRRSGLIAFGIVFAALVIIAIQPDQILILVARVQEQIGTVSSATFSDQYNAESARLNLARMASDIIAENPFFGVGAGGVEDFCQSSYYRTFGVCALHNWPLEIMSSFGIPVGILHLLSIVALFFGLEMARRSDTQNRALTLALATGFLASTVANFTSSSLMLLQPIWIFFGMVAAYINIRSNNVVQNSSRRAENG